MKSLLLRILLNRLGLCCIKKSFYCTLVQENKWFKCGVIVLVNLQRPERLATDLQFAYGMDLPSRTILKCIQKVDFSERWNLYICTRTCAHKREEVIRSCYSYQNKRGYNKKQWGRQTARQAGLQADRDEGIKSQLMSLCCAPQWAMSERW